MTHTTYDVIVAGLGGMGSAAAAHLAARGRRVLGLEQFGPAHDRGSSHGESRMIRQAYFEDPAYVPLLLRSYELWDDLNRDRPGILTLTGGLMLGTAAAATVAGSLASARQWNLPHELLDAADLRRRYPSFQPADDTLAVYEQRAGYVLPEDTVRTHLARAAARGAELRFGESVIEWHATDGGGVAVATSLGTYRAERLAVTAGAWAPTLLQLPAVRLQIERQVLYWFAPNDDFERYRSPAHPVFIWEDTDGMQLYGFPATGTAADGVKVAYFRGGPPADPDHLDRVIHNEEVRDIRARLADLVPGLAGQYLRGVACMYTNTPDENFAVGLHPDHPQVTVAAGFSGHGFKFVPVIGEIVADLVTDGTTRHPIDLFSPQRFTTTPAAIRSADLSGRSA